MTEAETSCLARHLSASRGYLEFGSGGSTFLACERVRGPVTSIESSAEWMAEMRGHAPIRDAEAGGRLTFIHAAIGPTADYGFPIGDPKIQHWAAYFSSVWDEIDPGTIDTVLVDGRFRVACALSVLLNCGESVKILVHDWERSFYHALLQFTDVTEQAERLVVLKPRAALPWREVGRAAQSYAFDPR